MKLSRVFYILDFSTTSPNKSIILALRLKNCNTTWTDVSHLGEKINLLEIENILTGSFSPTWTSTRRPLKGLSKLAYITFRFINFTRKSSVEKLLPFQNISMMSIGSLEVQCLSTVYGKKIYCSPDTVTYHPSRLRKLFPRLQSLSLTGVYSLDNRIQLNFPWDSHILFFPMNLSHFPFDRRFFAKPDEVVTTFSFTRTLGVTSNVGLNITNFCPYAKFLNTIVLIMTYLRYIPYNCFTPEENNTSALQTLDLTNNRLSSIENGTFKELRNLQTLHIADCRLTNLQVGLFDDLVNLKVLDLDYNKIKFLKAGIFSKLVSLEKLYIHNNSIQYIEYQSLPTYSNKLVFVDLKWNDLRTLPYDCLTLPNLYLCDCKVNKISLNNLTDIISHFDPIRMQLVEPLAHYGESYSNNRVGIMHEVGQSSIDLGDNNITGIGYSHSWSP